MMMRALAALLLVSTTNCQDACTTIGCSDLVSLHFTDARATGNGEYVFALEADAYRWTQRCTVAGSTTCTISGAAPPNQAGVTSLLGSGGNWVVAIAGTPAQVKLTLEK